jgi:hypothetical protein
LDDGVAKQDDPRALGKALTGPLGTLWCYRIAPSAKFKKALREFSFFRLGAAAKFIGDGRRLSNTPTRKLSFLAAPVSS